MSLVKMNRCFAQNRDRNCGLVRRQRGATLMELMISVFVFAIGVLGYSALQTRSLQGTFDNAQRDDVVWISDALVGRIRANNTAASQAAYVAALNNLSVCPAQPNPVCAEQQGGGAVAACNATQMATYDVWDELCNNPAGGLQAVKGLTVNLTAAGQNLTLTSTWCARSIEGDDEVTGGADGTCSHALAVQAYQLVFTP